MRRLLGLVAAGLLLVGMAGTAGAALVPYGTWVNATARNMGSGTIVDQAFNAPLATTGFAQAAVSEGANSGTATAACDLGGSLHVFASATGNNGIAAATTSFYDTLTYTAPAGFTGTFVPVTYSLHVSGSATGNSPWSSYWYGSISDGSNQANTQYNVDSNYNKDHAAALTDFWVTLTLSLPVTNGQASDRLTFGLGAYASPSGDGLWRTLDFSHTALVSQTLPEGWTFTSASGQFLNPAPVPLPGAMILLGSGLMGVVGLRKRLKK